MKIVFIGAVEFSASMLKVLIRQKSDVVGICTLQKAAENSDHVDLTELAVSANIKSRYCPDINSTESVAWIAERSPDIIFCFGWSKLIKPALLSLPPLGVIGYHPSALPANRGRHPIIWALALGLKSTGSTFFIMDQDADSGDIISQRMIDIDKADNAERLYNKITKVAETQLTEILSDLASETCARFPQNHIHSNYWRKRTYSDGQIDWRMPAAAINNLVRALSTPYPGAHFIFRGTEIKVWQSAVTPDAQLNIEPGKVLSVDGTGITVKAGVEAIRLIETDPGLSLRPGDYVQ